MEEKEYKGDGFWLIDGVDSVLLLNSVKDTQTALELVRKILLKHDESKADPDWEEKLLGSLFWGIKAKALRPLMVCDEKQWKRNRPLLIKKFRYLEPFTAVVEAVVIIK